MSVADGVAPNFSTLTPIDFQVRSEQWARYRLNDNAVLLTKNVVTKVFKVPEKDSTTVVRYHTASSFVLTTICPEALRGKPSNPQPDLSRPESLDSESIGFTPEAEPWNQYELKDGTLIFSRFRVTEVKRTRFVLPDGDPMYLVNWNSSGFSIDDKLRMVPTIGFKSIKPVPNKSMP